MLDNFKACCQIERSQNQLKICIENHENEREYIVVSPNETISDIKLKIFDRKIDPRKSQLYFQRKKLDNTWTVKDCQLKNDSKLYLIYGANINE